MQSNHTLRRILLVLTCVATLGCGSSAVQIPTSYTHFNAKDGSFACNAPEGWESKGGGKGLAAVWARFTSGPAEIYFKSSSTSKLANAALSGRSPDANAVVEFAPVHLHHVDAIKAAQEEYDGYTEIAGSPVVMNCSLGPARLSEFTYSTSFGTDMHGYRVSILGFDRGITVFCTCPEADWKTLQPIYDKVLASLQRGSTE